MKKTIIAGHHLLAVAALYVYKIYNEDLKAFTKQYEGKYFVEPLDICKYNEEYFFKDGYDCWSFQLDGDSYKKVLEDLKPEDKDVLISNMKNFFGWD